MEKIDYFETQPIFENLLVIVFSKSANFATALESKIKANNHDTCKISHAENISDFFANLVLYRKKKKIIIIDTLSVERDQEIYQIKKNLQQKQIPFILLLMSQKKKNFLNKKIYNFQIAEYPVSSIDLYFKIIDVLFFYQYKIKLADLQYQNNKYTNILSKFYSEDIIDIILKEDDNQQNLTDVRKEGTMLFFDIRGSTAISDNLEPEVFASFLNEIFTDIMDLIYAHQGSVNKMIGDGIFATFGCPIEYEGYTVNAVQCALEITKYLKTFNEFKPPYLKKEVGFGIGITTGQVFSGIIGSVRRKEYTVLGETVNRAAKLENMTKETESKVLFDENTKTAIENLYSVKRIEKQTIIRGRKAAVYYIQED